MPMASKVFSVNTRITEVSPMKTMVYRLNSGVSRLFLFALVAVMPALVQAESANDAQAVKALATDSSGALLVLRDFGSS